MKVNRPAKKTVKKVAVKRRKVAVIEQPALPMPAAMAGALTMTNKAACIVCTSPHFTGNHSDAAELIFKVVEAIGQDPAFGAFIRNPLA